VIFAIALRMGDEFDVDDLLEAPYKVKNEPEVSKIFLITQNIVV